MRTTIKEWKDEWIETNGKTNELEVVIRYKNFNEYIYEGSFCDIPNDLEERKVVESGRILDSTETERNGSYVLTIE
jgi:hypothetical protein